MFEYMTRFNLFYLNILFVGDTMQSLILTLGYQILTRSTLDIRCMDWIGLGVHYLPYGSRCKVAVVCMY